MIKEPQVGFDTIQKEIINYVMKNYPSEYKVDTIPLDQSLLELGVLDSFGVIELITFLGKTWSISIDDSEITKERMGSINKMCKVVLEKLGLE